MVDSSPRRKRDRTRRRRPSGNRAARARASPEPGEPAENSSGAVTAQPLTPDPAAAGGLPGDVAIVHDYLNQRGGAERVALELARLFPSAPMYTSLYRPDSTFPAFGALDVRTSFLDRVPIDGRFRMLFPLYPLAFRSLGSIDAELVISSSSGWAHAVRTSPRAFHAVYCYTPARWLYGEYPGHGLGEVALAPFAGAFRRLDVPRRGPRRSLHRDQRDRPPAHPPALRPRRPGRLSAGRRRAVHAAAARRAAPRRLAPAALQARRPRRRGRDPRRHRPRRRRRRARPRRPAPPGRPDRALPRPTERRRGHRALRALPRLLPARRRGLRHRPGRGQRRRQAGGGLRRRRRPGDGRRRPDGNLLRRAHGELAAGGDRARRRDRHLARAHRRAGAPVLARHVPPEPDRRAQPGHGRPAPAPAVRDRRAPAAGATRGARSGS